jgi:hypothetical protein
MSKKPIDPIQLVESHRPRNFKYFYNFTDESLVQELEKLNYDISSLDLIKDPQLIQVALNAPYTEEFDRTVIGKANQPTVFDDGFVIAKQLITKADKKLQKIVKSIFQHQEVTYVSMKLVYQRFEIIQIFILI